MLIPAREPQDDASVDFGDLIDQGTFDQILEMDDEDEDREFSKGIVFGFFEQAESTFVKMDEALYVTHCPASFRFQSPSISDPRALQMLELFDDH